MHFTRTVAASLIIAAGSAPWFLAQPAFAASTPSAILSLTPASGQEPIPTNFPVDVIVNTGGQGASAVEVYLTIPAGLQYASFDASTSKFDTNVTSPTVSGNRLHFDQALLAPGGFNGTGEVIRLFFTPTTVGSSALNIDQTTSQVVAYSDSTNILLSVNNATYAVVAPVAASAPVSSIVAISNATPTPAAAVTSMPVTGTSPFLLLLPFMPLALFAALRLRSYLGR